MKGDLKTTGLKFVPVTVCFFYFRYAVPYHTGFKEQIQMFMFSSSYLLSYFSKPAVFAFSGGDFLTQFLYFKTLGAAVVTLLLFTEWRLIYLILKRFSVQSNYRYALSLLPVMVEWICFPSISFSVALSVSFIIILSAFLFYTGTNGKNAVVTGLVLIPVLYVMAGASVFLFLVLVIFYDIHHGRKRFACWTVMSALAFTIPFIFRHFYLLSLEQAYRYPFLETKQGLSLVVLALAVFLFICKPLKTAHRKSAVIYFVSVLTGIAALVMTADRKLENLLGIVIEAGNRNWDKVLVIAGKAGLKNPIAAYYTNLALSEKNQLGERLMEFYQPFSGGLLLPGTPAPGSTTLTLFSGNDAYYHIGDMDMAQHAAMLGMMSMPRQRSARLTKRLAEINMATGDMPASMKYIRMLESTLFHRMDADGLKHKTHQTFKKDTMRSADDYKLSLELLTESNPDNLSALNYLLCFYLLNKDIPAFHKAYTSYCKGKIAPVPKVYAEALMIYFASTKASAKELSVYGIPPRIVRSCDEYTRLYQASNGMRTPGLNSFSSTYWYYYHFAVSSN